MISDKAGRFSVLSIGMVGSSNNATIVGYTGTKHTPIYANETLSMREVWDKTPS